MEEKEKLLFTLYGIVIVMTATAFFIVAT